MKIFDNLVVNIYGFADDIGMTIVARLLEEVALYANEAIYEIKFWLENAGLLLAEHKTEIVLITKQRKCTFMKINGEVIKHISINLCMTFHIYGGNVSTENQPTNNIKSHWSNGKNKDRRLQL